MDFLLLAISSFWLGALHALEPGHGKTVVGAYLVGEKGRVSDAILLGIVVTLTHSGSVIILGALSTVAAEYFVPETVRKVLEIVSGILVIAVGAWMTTVRIRESRKGGATHDHRQGDTHGHTHDDHHRGHSHGHTHARAIPEDKARPGLGQLIALGISGGIVPCPGALAVLLAAVSFGKFAQGLALVLIFSVGMAAVLVAIGIAMVKAAHLIGGRISESKWTRIVPIISAVLITLVGIGLTARAVLHLTGATGAHN